MSSSYTDAIGYLCALRDEVAADWFSYACDLAIVSNDSNLLGNQLEALAELFVGSKTSKPTTMAQPVPPTPSGSSPSSACFLAEISGFTNFKQLSPNLAVKFQKQFTVIFGTNGAGKSSLCKALKILARPDMPTTPVHNVRAKLPLSPSFCFQFRNDAAPTKWDSSQGYGKYATAIKFFDSKIAIRRITEPLEPEAVVEVTPFRLEVFSYCRSFVNALKDELVRRLAAIQTHTSEAILGITQRFTGVLPQDERAINGLSRGSHDALKVVLASYHPIAVAEQMTFQENEAALARLLQATTEQGLRLLQTEAAAIRELRASVQQFYDDADKLSPTEICKHIIEFNSKVETQQTLAATINPTGIQIETFKQFLGASKGVFDFANPAARTCPFCRRQLDAQALNLVQQYHQFLTSTLEAEIRALKTKINASIIAFQTLKTFTLKGKDVAGGMLSKEFNDCLCDCIITVKDAIPTSSDGFAAFDTSIYDKYTQLQPLIVSLDQEIAKRNVSIAAATSDKTVLDAELSRLTSAIQAHKYRQQFANSHDQLMALARDLDRKEAMQKLIDLTDFPTLLRKLTNLGKQAHRELVVEEFQTILDREYRALSAKGLSDFGIQLKSRGEQQVVSLETAIGDTAIERVLSEGEQKIHALALFFSELVAKPADIVVFDDPVTSFDYNYIATFSERLRNFVRDCPNSQVIVFTHNWDFFVQMQTVLNRSRLDPLLSVMVLENCDMIEEYKEDLDDLKSRAQVILGTAGDLSRSQKEQLSGYMRRMIETVVNKHVFNGQRHQYKQKSHKDSVFREYTKLVPLLPSEADSLRDLYANLSVTEHDDVRNAYVTRSKAMFQQWFDEIVNIDTIIIGRRP